MTDILLSAYNGETYLPELLGSLERQSCPDFRVIARSDGSTDGTLELLRQQSERDSRFTAVEGEPSGSPSGGFFAALALSDGDYAAFCDQDDVWHPDKLEKTLRLMKTAEEHLGKDTPLLVHTDLRVVDAELRELSPSMMRSQQLCPEQSGLPRLLCQSLVTGCTVLINAPLRSLVLSRLPEQCLMYDWWISLTAAAFGKILYLNEATIDYRQHGENLVGAKNVKSAAYLRKNLENTDALRKMLLLSCDQAAAFAACFADRLDAEQKKLVEEYAALPKLGKAEKLRTLYRLGTLKCGGLRRLGQLLLI